MVMRKPVRHLYEFGSFSLNVAERLLTCEGKTIQLAPKVFDTLQVLVENSGHLLEKEVLLEKLWPDTVVEESNLTTYISQLRKALGENGNSQSFIETVPRRGYRFVAEVREIHSDYDEILIHERTDTKIVVEEEFEFPLASTPQPVVSDQHFSENLISDQPPPQAVAKNAVTTPIAAKKRITPSCYSTRRSEMQGSSIRDHLLSVSPALVRDWLS